jgi:biopolymer transport protein TolQ
VLRQAYSQSRRFLDVFRKSSKFSEVNSVCAQLRASPLVGVFQAGYLEVNQQVRGLQQGQQPNPAPRTTVKSLESLSRAPGAGGDGGDHANGTALAIPRHDRERVAVHRPVRHGLGDHEGVRGHRRVGSASLATVAPGISEALITTAAGLFAAIPAAVFFNLYNSRVKVLSAMVDDFALEFLNLVERNFT